MVVHWRRSLRAGGAGQRRHLWVNAVGAAVTGLALAIILVAKFVEGAWITVLVIPCVIVLLKAIRRYYDVLAARVRGSGTLVLDNIRPPVVLLAMQDWNRLSEMALKLALSLSPDVIAVHLAHLSGPEAERHDRMLKADWQRAVAIPARAAGVAAPRLVVLPAQYRTIDVPFLRLVGELRTTFAGRRFAVLIPTLVKQHWWQHLLHNHRAGRLRARLLRPGTGLTVIDVPWYMDADPQDGAPTPP